MPAVKYGLWSLLLKDEGSLTQTQLTAVNYYRWLKLLSISMFEWSGLPDSINVNYLEETLFNKGRILFFKDHVLGHLALDCIPDGPINVYGEPVSFTINVPGYQSNGSILSSDSVLIKNNQMELPTHYAVGAFAGRLADVERTIDINIKAQKTPIMIKLKDSKLELSLRNAYKKYEDGQPVIIVDSNLITDDAITAMNTLAPYVVDKLDTHKMNLWNESLTYLGISNANTEKRERLITDEVLANEQHVEMSAATMLLTRKQAAEQINKLWPELNVSVKMRTETPIKRSDPKDQNTDSPEGVSENE